MPETIAIITGTSRGLGKEMMNILLENEMSIITINRKRLNLGHQKILADIEYDLSESHGISLLSESIFSKLDPERYNKIYLINNAAMLGKIKVLSENHSASLDKTIRTNLNVPMLLCANIAQKLKNWKGSLELIHISSGAAFHPIHGLGAYCISKAALEMLSRVFAEEHDPEFLRSICIGPGVIDTDMQKMIRNSNAEDFRQVERFKAFKAKKQLQSPESIGKKIIDFILEGNYQSGEHYDINSF